MVKLNSKGQKVSILDFYDGIPIVVRLYAALESAFAELADELRPDNSMLHCALHRSFYEKALEEFKNVTNRRSHPTQAIEG